MFYYFTIDFFACAPHFSASMKNALLVQKALKLASTEKECPPWIAKTCGVTFKAKEREDELDKRKESFCNNNANEFQLFSTCDAISFCTQ